MSFLSSSPSNTLQSIRQPSKNINKDSLVFTYPVIIDDKLRQFSDIIRDFLTVQFITQIKISNTLDLQVAASKANRIQADNRYINPAEELAKNLGSLSRDYSDYYDRPKQVSRYEPNDKYEYQNKINRLRGFIQDQIKNNPTYKDLNPIISTITIENLLDIPLVVGTKKYFVSSSVLFWMLFISAGYTPERESNPLRLDNFNNLTKIKRVMEAIKEKDYMKYFGSSQIENGDIDISKEYDDRQPSHRAHKLLADTESELDILMKYFNNVLDPKKWANEVGIYSDNNLTIQLGNTLPKLITIRKPLTDKCNVLFSGIMIDKVSPLFNSVANAIVSNDEVNVSKIISKKIEDVSNLTSQLFESLFDGVISGTVNEKDDDAVDKFQAKLDANSNICKILPTIPVENILRDLRTTYFGLTKTNTNEFADFVDKVVKISVQSAASINTLEKFIFRLATDGPRLKDIFKRYKEALENHIYYERMNLNNPDDGFGILDQFTRVKVPTAQYPNAVSAQPTFGNRLRMLLGGNDPKLELFQNLASALSNLIYFISLYCFLAYVCEYFKTLVDKLEVQRRDSLEFPNYCLVLRASVVEKLFMSLAAVSFQKQKQTYDSKINSRGKQEEDQEQTKNVLAPFKLNEKHMMNMIRLINERLSVPNLIVIDEKSKSVYYKFMFNSSQQMGNITIDNMKTFVSHQKDVFQVY